MKTGTLSCVLACAFAFPVITVFAETEDGERLTRKERIEAHKEKREDRREAHQALRDSGELRERALARFDDNDDGTLRGDERDDAQDARADRRETRADQRESFQERKEAHRERCAKRRAKRAAKS